MCLCKYQLTCLIGWEKEMELRVYCRPKEERPLRESCSVEGNRICKVLLQFLNSSTHQWSEKILQRICSVKENCVSFNCPSKQGIWTLVRNNIFFFHSLWYDNHSCFLFYCILFHFSSPKHKIFERKEIFWK